VPGVERLARKYAAKSWRLEYEELRSLGIVRVCEVMARVDATIINPVAYTVKAAELAMIDELRRVCRFSPLSLDAPLCQDGRFTLAETLEALPVSPEPVERVQALCDAVSRLSHEPYQVVLRRRHGFTGYGAYTVSEVARALKVTNRVARSLDEHARRALHQDARLCEALGIEIPVKPPKKPPLHTGATARIRVLLAENPDLSVPELSRLVGCDRTTARDARRQYLEAMEARNG